MYRARRRIGWADRCDVEFGRRRSDQSPAFTTATDRSRRHVPARRNWPRRDRARSVHRSIDGRSGAERAGPLRRTARACASDTSRQRRSTNVSNPTRRSRKFRSPSVADAFGAYLDGSIDAIAGPLQYLFYQAPHYAARKRHAVQGTAAAESRDVAVRQNRGVHRRRTRRHRAIDRRNDRNEHDRELQRSLLRLARGTCRDTIDVPCDRICTRCSAWLLATALLLMVLLFTAAQYRALQSRSRPRCRTGRGGAGRREPRPVALRRSPHPRRQVPCVARLSEHSCARVCTISTAVVAGHAQQGPSACPDAAERAAPPSQPSLRKAVLWHDVADRTSRPLRRPIAGAGRRVRVSRTERGIGTDRVPDRLDRRPTPRERAAAPLNALTESSRSIMQGDLGARWPWKDRSKCRNSHSAFNAVIDDLLAARRGRRRTARAQAHAGGVVGSRVAAAQDHRSRAVSDLRRSTRRQRDIREPRSGERVRRVASKRCLNGGFARERAEPPTA